jgi:hypothetical protein
MATAAGIHMYPVQTEFELTLIMTIDVFAILDG